MVAKNNFNINCTLCPRLVKYRLKNRELYPDWHNAPVASYGDINSKLLVLGLAPGVKGANRTGRPFTGDHAGILLYHTLGKFGFAKGEFTGSPEDTLELNNCRITNAVRCVPPENKPNSGEISNCRKYLKYEIEQMPKLHVILALGTIAHNAALDSIGQKRSKWKFGHNSVHRLKNKLILIDSYHCSRYNTNTGRLTHAMFENVFKNIREFID